MRLRVTVMAMLVLCAGCDRVEKVLPGVVRDDVGPPDAGPPDVTSHADSVGSTCSFMYAPDPNDGNVLNFAASDCPSGYCISMTGNDPLCTMRCDTDADCPAQSQGACPSSGSEPAFACRVFSRVGPFRCCGFCVCRAFVGQVDPEAQKCTEFGLTCAL